MLVLVVLASALGVFGLHTGASLLSDRRRRRGDVVGGIKVARAIKRLEAGERETAQGQLSEVVTSKGQVSVDPETNGE